MRQRRSHLALVVVLAGVGFVGALVVARHTSSTAKATQLNQVAPISLPAAKPVIHGLARTVAALPSTPAQLPQKVAPTYRARPVYVPPARQTAPAPKTTVIIPVPTQ